MANNGIRGFTNSERKENSADTTYEKTNERFVTVMPHGTSRAGLDVFMGGTHFVGAQDRTAEAGSTASILKLTGHDIKKGDHIRLKTTSNTIDEVDIAVRKVIDANNVELDGVLSASITAGDTFDILRPITARMTDDGSTAISLNGGIVAFQREEGAGAFTQNVYEDTVTPANNRPLPVKLSGVTGDVNITADNLDVQLTHTGGTPDSVRIGDGTETVSIDASNRMEVADPSALSIDGKLPATLGQKAKAASLAVTLASDEDNLNVDVASSALPTGAATSAKQDSQIALLPASIGQKAKAGSLAVTLATDEDTLNVAAASLPLPTGAATEATLAAQSAKLPASLGQKAAAASMSITLSSDEDVATETTLALQSAKLPASLGSKTSAASFSVTIASDEVLPASKGRSAIQFVRNDYSSTAVTDSAYVELIASVTSEANLLEIFDSSGETLKIAFGGSGSEVDQFLVQPGGNGKVEINVPAATRISIQSVSATPVNTGEISINLYS